MEDNNITEGQISPKITNINDFTFTEKKNLSIPLYIRQDDWSGEACLKRFDLWMNMRTINPKGFRKLRTSKHQIIKNPQDRFYFITKFASEFIEEQKKTQQPQGNLSFSTDNSQTEPVRHSQLDKDENDFMDNIEMG